MTKYERLYTADEVDGMIARAKAAAAKPAPVQEGWKLVPVVATREIEDAIGKARNLKASEIWEDALAATPPTQPAPVQHVKWEDAAQAAHPKSDPQYWPESLKVRFMEKEILQLRATPPAAAQRKPLTNEQKQSMWIAATIDPCSHMACYLRGIADTETAHGIKENT
jgi:hypothetical protein